MRTSTPIALFSFALALYAAPFAQAAAASSRDVRQLSDQNLFEVHLQNGIAASHKRLPSEVISHHERSEEEEDLVMPVAGSSSETPAPTTVTNADESSSSNSARQPSHFIKHFKHRSNKLGKRRLSDSQTALHFERDSDDLDSSVWQVSALVARVIDSKPSSISSLIASTCKFLGCFGIVVHLLTESSYSCTAASTETSSTAQQQVQIPTSS